MNKSQLSIQELIKAELLPGTNTEASIRSMIARRQLPFRKLNGKIFFLRDEIVEHLRACGGNPLPGKRRRSNPELVELSEIIQNFDASGIERLRDAIYDLTMTMELQNI